MQFLLLDPRPQAREEQIVLLRAHAPVLGIEVTVPELANACAINIDPQHTDGNADQAAIEVVAAGLGGYSAYAAVATVRADLDSVGAMAILTMYRSRIIWKSAINDRIDRIAQHDKFAFGSWRPRPLAEEEIDWELRGLGALIGDFKRSIEERVELMAAWLMSGSCAGLGTAIESARVEWAKALANSQVEERDGIAVVTSPHRFAMEIGYALAPVVVAANPAMRVNGGEPHLKYTIAQWPNSRQIDMPKLLAALQRQEPGWGGNVSGGIIGSPQGVGSALLVEEVISVVLAHRIFDYGLRASFASDRYER